MEIQGFAPLLGWPNATNRILYFCSLCGHTKTETALLEEVSAA